MAKTRLQYITDFETNIGITEAGTPVHIEGPALAIGANDSGTVIDVNSMANFGIVYYLGFSNVLNTKHRLLLGPDGSGIGKAIDFELTSTQWNIHYVSTTSINDASPTVHQTKNIKTRSFSLVNNAMYKVRVYLSGATLKVFFNEIHVLDVTDFTYSSSSFVFSGVNSVGTSYVSDCNYYTDQCFHGNVNLSGSNMGTNGRVVVYDQTTFNPITKERTDSGGDYVVFIEDDPANNNKYLMYAYIDNRGNVQPKGVGNLTI